MCTIGLTDVLSIHFKWVSSWLTNVWYGSYSKHIFLSFDHLGKESFKNDCQLFNQNQQKHKLLLLTSNHNTQEKTMIYDIWNPVPDLGVAELN